MPSSTVAIAAACSDRSGRSSEPAGPKAGAGAWTGVAAGAGVLVTTGPVAAVAGAAVGAVLAPASSAVSMIAISALLGTVAPSSTRIWVRVP